MFYMEECLWGPSEEETVSRTGRWQVLGLVPYLQGGLTQDESGSSSRFCGLLELTDGMNGADKPQAFLHSGWFGSVRSIARGLPSQHERMSDHSTRQKWQGAAGRNVSCVGSYTNHQEGGIFLWGDPSDAFKAWCFCGALWESITNDLVLLFQTYLLFSSITTSSLRGVELSLDFFSLAVGPCSVLRRRRHWIEFEKLDCTVNEMTHKHLPLSKTVLNLAFAFAI